MMCHVEYGFEIRPQLVDHLWWLVMRELRRRRENVKEIKRSGPAEKTQVSRYGANVPCGGLSPYQLQRTWYPFER